MITLHGKCNMCGRLEASIEVEVPHATNEHRKAVGVSTRGVMCTALCRLCVRNAVSAWAAHGAADWAKMKADVAEAKAEADDT